ncbi:MULTISPECIES: methylenetetrahydrofolate reductase [NAD(P)H] [Ectothiorhodospira]|uniref:Methylenetetrahydrofolate reductase n=1 Tax=Ectothiorhodospira marina TaxID=1396821 RepID=A0A1H7K3N9_9GAMM|nr:MULTISPECIES: methylenetetrahydrofolate reductase [NAD(P)H] [Ectothiorhodospira]MCG5516618.1 methylenetetrahydrofolate reductase [NAD(P)H] [Ectothiorhodospira sp. 9100]MCG5519686.1 methylenetetrahydrofolate reductase [NAD(P)H] [Ectothiorhodospira sp. 9905]SEK81429.1 methylenetetrahydrofolate reductase (NADPH) [Ectothiorhodospira marina]
MKTQKQHERTFSFEFFPPKNDEGAKKLKDTWTDLAQLEPRFFSVTYGAGGSTQARTLETVLDIHKNSGVDAAPHLSCIDSTAEQMRGILQLYKDNGLRHIVALRGDLPSGMRDPGEFRYANELVEFIRKETGDHFTLEVAAYPEFHPQAPNALKDMQNFKRKVDAGADSAITQYFYSAEAYFRFVEDCEKLDINIPIVPGIMPITNYKQLARFSDACGAEIPRWIRKRLEAFGEDSAAIKAFGEEVITDMCAQLLEAGAPGLHFYTMNQSGPIKAIWKNLGLKPEPK